MNKLELDPADRILIEKRQASKTLAPYIPKTTDEVRKTLDLLTSAIFPETTLKSVKRIGGGASREQFIFSVSGNQGEKKFVLRMDPALGITETDRRREFEILREIQGSVPAPMPVWFDDASRYFDNPAMIMEFCEGVAKPSDSGLALTGLGTNLGDRLRPLLKDEFLAHLTSLHKLNWQDKTLPSFHVPDADPKQAGRWILNYWKALWEVDKTSDRPIVTYAFEWLERNIPDCEDLVITHNDYRTGNYLFDEASGKITAILDWEYARIGDFHDDLAYILNDVFVTTHTGKHLHSDLFEREEFISRYQSISGRKVNRKTLNFYEVLAPLKTYIIVAAHGISAARRKQNHQDVMLTYVAATSALLLESLTKCLEQGPTP